MQPKLDLGLHKFLHFYRLVDFLKFGTNTNFFVDPMMNNRILKANRVQQLFRLFVLRVIPTTVVFMYEYVKDFYVL